MYENFKITRNTFCGLAFFQVNLWPMLFSQLATHKCMNLMAHKAAKRIKNKTKKKFNQQKKKKKTMLSAIVIP